MDLGPWFLVQNTDLFHWRRPEGGTLMLHPQNPPPSGGLLDLPPVPLGRGEEHANSKPVIRQPPSAPQKLMFFPPRPCRRTWCSAELRLWWSSCSPVCCSLLQVQE